jgi:phosphonate ABC transporter permease subunit PhnE
LWGLGALILAAVLVWPLIGFGSPLFSHKQPSTAVKILRAILLLAAILLVLFSVVVLAQLGVGLGHWLRLNLGLLGFLGSFVFIISDLLRLLFAGTLALVGAAIALSLGNRYGEETILKLEDDIWARLVTGLLAALGTAVFIYGIGSALDWLYQFENRANWTTIPAVVGGTLVGLAALAVRPKHQYPIGLAIYAFTRGLLNIMRSIEPIILAVVFVIWVGLGPFAGILALMVHSVADLGKLFSEEVENIAQGPIEAITATGASRLQTIAFAVVPQIIPPYISFIFYRWDINVRMSTIIGFVGGGGIGAVLQLSVNLLQYRRASVMILAIALTVSLLDYISAELRSRLV